ncbi:MAG: hypothetical protein ABSG43_03540 [Solirubrobacteraceae bacterium]
MSVQKRVVNGKVRYLARWREGGRDRARTFVRRSDAVAFDLDLRRRQQLGALAATVLQSRMTLGEFVETEWWPRHAVVNTHTHTLEAEHAEALSGGVGDPPAAECRGL